MEAKKIISLYCLFLFVHIASAQTYQNYALTFDKLATRWDEAIPLGNGLLGALVWQKDANLRISIDRADLWDERKAFDLDAHNFDWVRQQVDKKEYKPV
ncbi:MAG: glycoside hydrolase N-terminal domain-containing protein, partial [Sphingobacterium sp.]